MYLDKNNGSKSYEWKSCSEQMWAFCKSDSDHSCELYKELKSWRNAATLCFQNNGYPIGYEAARNVTYMARYGWTGIVWSDVIFKETELYRKNMSDISHGYLKYESSLGYVLHFAKHDDARKYILCNGEPVIKETTMIRTKAHSSIPMSKTPETPVTPTGEMKRSSNDSSFDDTDLTVVVWVSVSATLLVVIIVILLVLVKR
ncbi:uncharacterized protein LOC132752594 [Ruditapes philippinarum]|uniref:uncharacterized protein LOC132752594 n=1 Tax=Ruditapes philippinarum TaxID=129788 RepID=UPI00295BBBE5|nr:uncharacterized protein LOC132752594 [Ruditapes philippinarum]